MIVKSFAKLIVPGVLSAVNEATNPMVPGVLSAVRKVTFPIATTAKG